MRWADKGGGGGGGGGTDDQTAAEVSLDASGLTGNLSDLDDASNVAAAMAEIDDFDLEDTFKGPWSAGTYRGGQSVVHSPETSGSR